MTLKVSRPNVKLAMVSMIPMPMVKWLLRGLGSRHAYLYTTRPLLSVYSSREQFKKKLSLVTYIYIACQAAETLILTARTYVTWKYLTHYVQYLLLPRSTNISAQRTSIVCMRTNLLCTKTGVLSFCAKNWISTSCKLAVSSCPDHDFQFYHLCTAICAALPPRETTFCANLFAGPYPLLLILEKSAI